MPIVDDTDILIGSIAPQMRLRYFHRSTLTTLDVWTGALTPTEAGQAMKDAVTEMRAVMATAHVYPRVVEPDWLTDGIDEELERRARFVTVGERITLEDS